MAEAKGYITASFAQQIAEVVNYVNKLRRRGEPLPKKRRPIGQGYLPVLLARLDEDLLSGASAEATLWDQAGDPDEDGTGGAWTEGDGDPVRVFDKVPMIPDGKQLDEGVFVWVTRNPASGLLNLFNANACPVMQPEE